MHELALQTFRGAQHQVSIWGVDLAKLASNSPLCFNLHVIEIGCSCTTGSWIFISVQRLTFLFVRFKRLIFIIYIKTLYSSIKSRGLFSTKITSHSNGAESLFLLEGNEEHRKSSSVMDHLPWTAHGISLLMCFSLLFNSINLYQKSERRCIERFNAYCKSSTPSHLHTATYLHKHLSLKPWTKNIKTWASSTRYGISPPTKALLLLRFIKRSANWCNVSRLLDWV